MPPRITRVRWQAENLPWGIGFNENTGTFSGTPYDAGDYIIPVRVDTNYGWDKKNVTFRVLGKTGTVYVKGKGSSNASDWSNGAAEDSDGFRKINMPKASKLVPLNDGFAARTAGSIWYVVGDHDTENNKYYGLPGFSASDSPQQFPVSNVTSMAGGVTSGSTAYFAYLTSDNVGYFQKSSNQSSSTTATPKNNVIKLHSGFISGSCYLMSDSTIYIDGYNSSLSITAPVRAEQIKTIIYTGMPNQTVSADNLFYLTQSGDLYQGTDKISFNGGFIRDIYGFPNNTKAFFVTTEDCRLYARGSNLSYALGFSTTTTRQSLELVGAYDVKKIVGSVSDGSLLLTSDGRLLHTGTYINSSITGITRTIGTKHQGFVQVFPNKKFLDIAVVGGTIIAIIEE